ncbi:unnamed protein product [Cyprideis torosa]|uniref:Uncharacterized protein n=1 Tax=Cyprideis torosa TaxID=163714 RepID=A0A7R8WD51_9CRUS|nr:unnamed protein product [Cyprideis torosa]CAG0887994.1 unnamed protein product [Cyprideis torosa]
MSYASGGGGYDPWQGPQPQGWGGGAWPGEEGGASQAWTNQNAGYQEEDYAEDEGEGYYDEQGNWVSGWEGNEWEGGYDNADAYYEGAEEEQEEVYHGDETVGGEQEDGYHDNQEVEGEGAEGYHGNQAAEGEGAVGYHGNQAAEGGAPNLEDFSGDFEDSRGASEQGEEYLEGQDRELSQSGSMEAGSMEAGQRKRKKRGGRRRRLAASADKEWTPVGYRRRQKSSYVPTKRVAYNHGGSTPLYSRRGAREAGGKSEESSPLMVTRRPPKPQNTNAKPDPVVELLKHADVLQLLAKVSEVTVPEEPPPLTVPPLTVPPPTEQISDEEDDVLGADVAPPVPAPSDVSDPDAGWVHVEYRRGPPPGAPLLGGTLGPEVEGAIERGREIEVLLGVRCHSGEEDALDRKENAE